MSYSANKSDVYIKLPRAIVRLLLFHNKKRTIARDIHPCAVSAYTIYVYRDVYINYIRTRVRNSTYKGIFILIKGMPYDGI